MKKCLALIGILVLGLLPTKTFAAAAPFGWAAPSMIQTNFQTVQGAIPAIFNVVIMIAAIAFVILFLIGGILYLSSSGNEEAANKAKKLLIDAVIGIVIVAIAWAAGTWIINQFFTNLPTS